MTPVLVFRVSGPRRGILRGGRVMSGPRFMLPHGLYCRQIETVIAVPVMLMHSWI